MTVACLEMATIARESCLNVPGAIMKRILVVVAVATLGWPFAQAHAAPPTATPSPGYDARLQEQRRAASTRIYEPPAPVEKPAAPHRHRKKRPAH
jgi:hypothetical protein